MAPRYAPSLRSRLAPLLLFLQLGFIVIYAFCIEIDASFGGVTFNDFYPGECSGAGKKQAVEPLFLCLYIFGGVMVNVRYMLNTELWGGAAVIPGGQ